jgi:glycosyltransferase involved in cell wall biosynthesis
VKVLGIPIRVAGASHGNLNYLVNLAVCLKKHGKNWEPAVLTSPNMLPVGSREVLERCGATIIDMPYFAQRPTAGGFARAVIGNDPEVRVAAARAGLDCIFENATFYGHNCGLPVLHWIPDLQHRELPDMFPLAARLRRELLIRCVLMSGRSILMSSTDARDAMLKYYAPDAERLHIARFASALIGDERPPESAAELADLGMAIPFAFVPNQFWRHKNHLILPRAAKLVSERGIKFNFVCTGEQSDPRSSEYFAEFDRLVCECDVRDRFVTPGLVPYARVRTLHQQSAMLINPSFVEGWNTGVEEAKFLGSRLVLSDIGTHREQVLNYSRAKLFDSHSPILLADAICETLVAGAVSQEEVVAASAAYDANIRDFVDAVELALSQTT